MPEPRSSASTKYYRRMPLSLCLYVAKCHHGPRRCMHGTLTVCRFRTSSLMQFTGPESRIKGPNGAAAIDALTQSFVAVPAI